MQDIKIMLYILMVKLFEVVDQRPKTYCIKDDSSEFYTFYNIYLS